MAGASGDQKDKTTSFPWEQQLCRRFSFADIQSATQDFDDALIIGQGGFGKVYKGPIENGVGGITVAAIKRLDCGSNQGASEFWAEIEMLSKLRHCHLVSLIGYCNDNDEMILVYEYMPRGTLYDHLYKLGTSLAWVQRLEICIGVARGLDYLHTGTGTQHGVIHRDIKSSNILLDENWAAKISDFGLSKIGPTNQASTYVNTAIKGTFGYVDPDYFTTGKLSRRTDVYAFGVILFEVVSGRRAVDSSLDEEQWSLARWAQYCIRKGRLDQLVDPNLSGQIFPKCLKKFVQIAGSCLENCPKQRPTMAEAIVSLEFVVALQGRNDNSIQLQPASIITLSKRLLEFFLPSTELNSAHIAENTSTNNKTNIDGGGVLIGKQIPMKQELKQFSLSELKRATKDFNKDNRLGWVDYGEVFKGWVDEKAYSPSRTGIGLAIAVQKLHAQHLQMSKEWQLKLKSVGKINHPNVVKLLGYCSEDAQVILVYEFVPNGSLDSHLFSSVARPLPWVTRIQILVGAARGLAFLHNSLTSFTPIVCSPFQTSSILLDKEFNAMVSDAALDKLKEADDERYIPMMIFRSSYDHHTVYTPPEYSFIGKFGVKGVVYGFGVVLLETLTGRRMENYLRRQTTGVVRGHGNKPFHVMIRSLLYRNGMVAVDARLKQEFSSEGARLLGQLALLCLQDGPECRPSMVAVLKNLENIQNIKDGTQQLRISYRE